MSTVDLYRTLIPAHAAVDDAVVSTYLELSAQQHTASVFGAVYQQAMVWHAAHRLERTPGLVSGSGGAGETGALVAQRDGDLSRTYAQPQAGGAVGTDAELRTTRYGEAYLGLRDSRAGVGPFVATADGAQSW
jgi:hypothetical protein